VSPYAVQGGETKAVDSTIRCTRRGGPARGVERKDRDIGIRKKGKQCAIGCHESLTRSRGEGKNSSITGGKKGGGGILQRREGGRTDSRKENVPCGIRKKGLDIP